MSVQGLLRSSDAMSILSHTKNKGKVLTIFLLPYTSWSRTLIITKKMLRVQRTRCCANKLFMVSDRLSCKQRKQQFHFIYNKSSNNEYDTCLVSDVKKISNENRPRRVKNIDSVGHLKCGRGQSVRGPRACTAYGNKCATCVYKKVSIVTNVSVVLHPIKVRGQLCDIPRRMTRKKTIDKVNITVKLDIGAQVSVLPLDIFKKVREGQEGVEKTKVGTKQLFYWPRMSTGIEQMYPGAGHVRNSGGLFGESNLYLVKFKDFDILKWVLRSSKRLEMLSLYRLTTSPTDYIYDH
ncbi:hypothetical protein PR048_011234 [Dryococelus australis]|uniref:Peptidase A2 domain-containing protein n=1 Tax=Dryococelus australis TaxID=614101 RepID=A0ABQ9HMC0_9NEOP|nr:hypothetical protein PR048_011234 [Dryococelus australis]